VHVTPLSESIALGEEMVYVKPLPESIALGWRQMVKSCLLIAANQNSLQKSAKESIAGGGASLM
jgi:hypothetical protein